MTDREIMQQALDALEFPHDSEWSNKAKAIEALQHALAQPEQAFVPFPSFMRKRIEEAMEDAIHPKGMSVHDGKANVLASDLHRMLLVIDSVLAQPEQDWDLLAATQESLREHMAKVKELEAQLAQPEQESKPMYVMGNYAGEGKVVSASFGLPKGAFEFAPYTGKGEASKIKHSLEPQPVAKHICNLWINPETSEYEVDRCTHPINEVIPVYTAPPRKEWVGLTDDEIDTYAQQHSFSPDKAPEWFTEVCRDIEAKLKEKNT